MKSPNRHLIALINYFALVPLVFFIPQWVSPYLPEDNFLQVCIVVAIIVPIISYIVMPITMKLLNQRGAKK
jgi:antibiotic biosynthesis monooxygenase (ABM) superfamily enzyme